MSNFQISIAFQSNKTPMQYRALAQLVNRYAFSHVSVYNDLTFQPALGPLLLMAPELQRAQLGPACLNPFTVHPMEIAGQIAVLDQATQGRAYLGIARGAWLESLGVNPAQPIAGVREAIQIFQQLLAGERCVFQGRVFQLGEAHYLPYERFRSRIPVMVGAWGPKLATVAGELADEVKVSPIAHPPGVAHIRKAMDDGARKAGRSPDAVKLVLGGMCVIDNERARARDLARREVSRYLDVVAPLDPTFPMDDDWFARFKQARQSEDWDATAKLISDEILDRFVYAGNATDLIRLLENARAHGIARVELGTPHGIDEAEGVRLLGEQVLPHFTQ
jgi:5,10-methylenetetrahydromethanopterin reductase